MSAEARLQAVRAELKARFIEREQVVDGALLAVLCRQHLLLLGPPGTAKSMLAKDLCHRVGGKTYFEWLLTKFTTPEEIFGPVSLEALEAGRYERVIDGKLPCADVAFLDEVFKANSAILNALLTVLNERRFHQGAEVMPVPLLTLVAASNELPDEEELAALYDRFLLRFTVGYIQHDYKFARLLSMAPEPEGEPTRLTPAELAELQAKLQQIAVPDGVLREIIDIRKKLNTEGVVASDRRYRQAVQVLRAAAVLEGRAEVQTGDLRWLEHVLWSDPEDQPKVAQVLGQALSGLESEAKKLLFQAKEVHAYAYQRWPSAHEKQRALLEALSKIRELRSRLLAMLDQARDRGRDTTALQEIADEVSALEQHLLGNKV
ncbi:MAG: AAA family ATPase [Myxococcales bacterium]|nr:AAA family ATPase [Myxococcales bacterium]